MSLTRKEIRRAVGHDLQGAPIEGGMTIRYATAATVNTLTDPGLIGNSNAWLGSFIVVDTHIAVVTAFDPSEKQLTFAPSLDAAPTDLDYELWDEKYNPQQVNALINEAIGEAETNGVFTPVNVDDVYLPPSARRIKAPDDWRVLRSVESTRYGGGYSGAYGGSYYDLMGHLFAADDVEADSEFYPFQTVKLEGSGTFTLDQSIPLGLYDAVGWEVAGEFNGDDDLNTTDLLDFRFVRQTFNPLTVDRDGDENVVLSYDAGDDSGSYVLAVYLYREAQVSWYENEFMVWENSGEIELESTAVDGFYFNEGLRLRLHGGTSLPLLSEDTDEAPISPTYIRMQALVSLLRSIPQILVGEEVTTIRREWEIRAAREYGQLPRLQSVRYLSLR